MKPLKWQSPRHVARRTPGWDQSAQRWLAVWLAALKSALAAGGMIWLGCSLARDMRRQLARSRTEVVNEVCNDHVTE